MASIGFIALRDQSRPSNEPMVLGVVGFLTSLSLIAVSLRMYVRHVILKTVGVDDWLIILAMLAGTGGLVCFVGGAQNGLGHHIDDIGVPDELERMTKWTYILMIHFITGISLVKLSISCFLLRLFEGKWYKRFLVATMVFIVSVTIACEGPMIFECIPVSAIWKSERPASANCISRDAFNNIGILNGSVNVFTDFILVALPIHIVMRLQMNLKKKIALVCILGLGLFACIIATVRVAIGVKFFTAENRDYTWNCVSFILNAAELHIGILCASLPSLRPLFSKMLGSTTDYGTGDRHTSRYGRHTDNVNTNRNGYRRQDDIPMDDMGPWPTRDGYGNPIISATRRGAGDASSEEGILAYKGIISVKKEVLITEETYPQDRETKSTKYRR